MTAGQIWRRADGLVRVEVQTAAADRSGWRLMIPLVDPADAPDAPPLVVPAGRWRARVHLLSGVPEGALGEPAGHLDPDQLAAVEDAARTLINRSA